MVKKEHEHRFKQLERENICTRQKYQFHSKIVDQAIDCFHVALFVLPY